MGVYRICKWVGSKFYSVNIYGYESLHAGGLGVLPQENLEIWSALGVILGLPRVSSYITFYPYFLKENRLLIFHKESKIELFFHNYPN